MDASVERPDLGLSVSPFEPLRTRFSRRSVLGALSALAIGTVTGCSALGTSDSEDFGGGRSSGAGAGRGALRTQYQLQKPYTLQAASELTEDFFMVQALPIDYRRDTVVAYSRADGDVEAIVLQSGVVRQYYRDPTQAGGWGSHAVSDPTTPDVEAVVAGMSSVDAEGSQGNGSWLKVFWTRKSDPARPRAPYLFVSTEKDPPKPGTGPQFADTKVDWSTTTTDLQLSLNVDDSLLVSGLQPSSSGSYGIANADARLYFWTDGRTADHPHRQSLPPTDGYLSGFAYTNLPRILSQFDPRPPWAAVVAEPYQGNADAGSRLPTLMLYLPAGSYADDPVHGPAVRIWARTLRSGSAQTLSAVDWSQEVDTPGPLDDIDVAHTAVSVELASTLGGQNSPTVLVQTLSLPATTTPPTRRLFVGSHDCRAAAGKGFEAWTWTELGSPVLAQQGGYSESFSSGLRPLDPSTERSDADQPTPRDYLDVFQLANGVLSVYRQAPTGSAYLDYSDPSYCAPIPLESGVGLMAGQVGESSGDELLYLGADGKLRILVKDPTSGWSSSVCQLPAEELQPMPTYRVLLTATDASGYPLAGTRLRVSASTTAAAMVDRPDGTTVSMALDTTPLELTADSEGQVSLALAADGASAPTLTIALDDQSTTTVFPSLDVNTYFQGGSQLGYLAPVDDAGTLADAKTSTGAPLFPQAAEPAQAKDALATMAAATTQATANGLKAASESSVLERRDGTLPAGYRGGRAAVEGIGRDIDRWGHDGLHAIKRGAAKVKSVAHDVEKGVFHLVGDFEGWADGVITIVVKGIEDAAHVVHAILSKLGAAINEAVHWLKVEVIGTLKDSFKLAGEFEGWFKDGMSPYLSARIKDAKTVAVDWLTKTESGVTADFDTFRSKIERKTTFASLAGHSTEVNSALRTPRRRSDGGDGQPTHGRWLYSYSKLKLHPELKMVGAIPDFEAKLSLLAKTIEGDAGEALIGAFDGFKSFLIGTIVHPEDVGKLIVKDLLDQVSLLVTGVFELAKAIVEVFCDLAAGVVDAMSSMLFTTPLIPMPGLAALLKAVGVDEPSLGRFVMAILAFPAVVAYKVKHKGQGFPFDSPALHGARKGQSASDALRISAAAGIGIWSVVDSVAAGYIAIDEEPPRFIEAIDIAAPLIIGLLTMPNTEDAAPFHPPSFDEASTVPDLVSWLFGMAPSVFAGLIAYGEHAGNGVKEVKSTVSWAVCACGVLSLIFGCAGAGAGADYGIVVVNNLPVMSVPLLLDDLVESSEGVTAIVNIAITTVAGLTGATLLGIYG